MEQGPQSGETSLQQLKLQVLLWVAVGLAIVAVSAVLLYLTGALTLLWIAGGGGKLIAMGLMLGPGFGLIASKVGKMMMEDE